AHPWPPKSTPSWRWSRSWWGAGHDGGNDRIAGRDAPRRVGASRRRGLPVGRADGDRSPQRAAGGRGDGHGGGARHERSGAVAAWRRRGGRGQLWYASQLDSFHDEWGELNQRVGVFGGQVPPCTPAHEAAAVVNCEGWLLERKQAALRAHASQVQPLIDLVGD